MRIILTFIGFCLASSFSFGFTGGFYCSYNQPNANNAELNFRFDLYRSLALFQYKQFSIQDPLVVESAIGVKDVTDYDITETAETTTTLNFSLEHEDYSSLEVTLSKNTGEEGAPPYQAQVVFRDKTGMPLMYDAPFLCSYMPVVGIVPPGMPTP